MHGHAEENAKKLVEILDENPLGYNALMRESRLKKGTYKSALRWATNRGMIAKHQGAYCIPGQRRLAEERAAVGSIGNRNRLVLVKETFHDIFMLRISDYAHDGSWKKARLMAQRIEPMMRVVKEKDRDFPYSEKHHRALDYHPEALIPDLEEPYKNWQKYCAEVLEYCDRKLSR